MVESIAPITLFNGSSIVDDRGLLSFVNEFDFADKGIRRFYNIENHRSGFCRAWHGHLGETKYLFAEKGVILVGLIPIPEIKCRTPTKIILSENNPKVLQIPANYFNGIQTLTDGAKLKVYSTSTLEQSIHDDIRLSFDYWPDFWKEKPR